MDHTHLARMTAFVAVASLVLTALGWAFGGASIGFGALVGGVLAVANLYALRWLAERLLRADDRGKVLWSSVLAIKLAGVLGLAWAILATGMVNPIGFGLGLSGLVLGSLAGGFAAAMTSTPTGEEG